MSNLREDIALRLTEERGRLGYSKANLAHIAEISNEQLRLYEAHWYARRIFGEDF